MPIIERTGKPGYSIYIGVDPGASGGLAVILTEAVLRTDRPIDVRVEHSSMPSTEKDIWEWFQQFINNRSIRGIFAVIEKVQGYIGQRQPGSAMFKFGYNAGMLHGFLTTARIPYEEITPQRWQKALGITPRKKKESRTVWKNRLKLKAQQLYPNEKITLAVADALLIATYCMRKQTGTL